MKSVMHQKYSMSIILEVVYETTQALKLSKQPVTLLSSPSGRVGGYAAMLRSAIDLQSGIRLVQSCLPR